MSEDNEKPYLYVILVAAIFFNAFLFMRSMHIAKEAFTKLFPEKDVERYEFKITYSGKFKPYNANVRYTRNDFTFNLSRKWKGVSRDIQIGLLQSLLLKVFKEKQSTMEIGLYNAFLKRLDLATPKTKTDRVLEQSFNRVNRKYLNEQIDLPNLTWHDSMQKLGSYEYSTDTISISKKLVPLGQEFIDYVMYHEMLHKKHKFACKNNRNVYHSREFREEEKRFENSEKLEEALQNGIKRQRFRRKPVFRFF